MGLWGVGVDVVRSTCLGHQAAPLAVSSLILCILLSALVTFQFTAHWRLQFAITFRWQLTNASQLSPA